MIFKLPSQIEQNIFILFMVVLLFFLIYRLFYRYYVYTSVKSDYYIFFEETSMDHLTQEKLITYWKTNKYNEYFESTISSIKQSKNETIVFAGLCQDHGASVLKMWMPILKKLGGYFKDYRVIIVENDSKDNSRELFLKEAERNDKLIVLCDDNTPENAKTCKLDIRSVRTRAEKETTLARRVRILGKFRQVYWNYILKKFNDYDYMCVIDWDLEGQLSIPGFFHGLYYTRNYSDVVACNSFHNYKNIYLIYDTYPLLNHHRCDYLEANKMIEDLRANYNFRNKLFYEIAYPLPVESAYGGLALYNIQKIKKKDPDYTDQTCHIECEHSTFHRNLDVHIDPWMTFFIEKNNH